MIIAPTMIETAIIDAQGLATVHEVRWYGAPPAENSGLLLAPAGSARRKLFHADGNRDPFRLRRFSEINTRSVIEDKPDGWHCDAIGQPPGSDIFS